MRNTVILLLLLLGAAFPNVVGYHVDPVKALWSGWALGDVNHGVAQVITINFDELDSTAGAYCELFAGTEGGGGDYHVSVRTYPGDVEIASGNAGGNVDHEWVKFNLAVDLPESIVKGKKLEFRFTRGGGDSIMYYYDTMCGYHYGQMIAPYPPLITPDFGLAMRCYGRMNPVSDVWRACANHWADPWPDNGGRVALAKAESIGIKWIREDFNSWPYWVSCTAAVMSAYRRYVDTLGISIVGILSGGRNDTASSYPRGDTTVKDTQLYPVRNLDSACTDSRNFWASYCRSMMDSMPAVKYWEIWPEMNAAWSWRNPDTHYYRYPSGGPIDTPRERCSLYVRMCCIAESVAHELGGDPLRKVVGGGTWRVTDPTGDGEPGVDWIRDMFELAENSYGGIENCFDIVSVHPYTWQQAPPNYFDEGAFRTGLDTARTVMRNAGYPGMELWATEYGWPRWSESDTNDTTTYTDTLVQADNVGKFMVSAIASQSDPHGGYDRAVHYELTAFRTTHKGRRNAGGYGFLDTTDTQPRVPHGWAFGQLDSLTGKRFNGRFLTGDTAVDNHTRMYEFEDTTALKKRTWVCWQDEAVSAYTPLPVRNDEVDTVALAYDSTPPASQKDAAPTGWLNIALHPRPAFVAEKSATSRPDLVVDSVKYVPPPSDTAVLAWVTNRGSRATPLQSPGGVPYPTRAILCANGDSLTEVAYTDSIPADSSVVFEFARGAVQTPQTALFSVLVNPGQSYVELGTDDNSGYRLKAQP